MRRTAWHIKVLKQREAVAARAPTGRPGQRPGGMAAFLGAGGSPLVHGKRPAANAKGLGAKAAKPAAQKPAAPVAPAAHGKRKEAQPTQTVREDEAGGIDDSDDRAGAAGGSGLSGLQMLGAAYGESDDEQADGAPPAEQRAAAGAVKFRKLTTDEQAAYKKAANDKAKGQLQEKMAQKYVWLKCELKPKSEGSAARGWHCVVCISSRLVAAHKAAHMAAPRRPTCCRPRPL
eukprot:6470580-Prymnesium_polylepis.1